MMNRCWLMLGWMRSARINLLGKNVTPLPPVGGKVTREEEHGDA